MSDSPFGSFGPLLSTLRALPLWVLAGLALAGYAVLFFPAFGGIDPTQLRIHWGVWIWIEALTFSILTIARAVEGGVRAHITHRKAAAHSRALRLIPLHHQCWWHLAKQQDDSFVSQIGMDIQATNLTDLPVRIVKANLIRPKTKGELLHADISLPKAGSPYHSSSHAVPPHGTVRAGLHIMVRGSLARQGHPIRVTFGITDQFGDLYRLKKVEIRTSDPLLPVAPWTDRVKSRLNKLVQHGGKDRLEGQPEPLPAEWEHGGKYDAAVLVLKEEKRAYVARGRSMGGLGSLNVGLQSEPNFGWAKAGDVPNLLWDKSQAQPIESPNIERLLKFHGTLDQPDKNDLEKYLLSHLHKKSPYAEIGYFIFLALHRMGRTVDALRQARTHLAGDKVYGYSNLLGVLSGLVSREHFNINPGIYPQLLEALSGDTEHDFRLKEKINLARLQDLDSQFTA